MPYRFLITLNDQGLQHTFVKRFNSDEDAINAADLMRQTIDYISLDTPFAFIIECTDESGRSVLE